MVTLCPSPPDLPLPTLFPPLEGLTDNSPPALLSAVLEGFNEGILIINQAGQLLHANHLGQTLAHQLNQWEGTDMAPVPPSLWTICSYLLEGRDLFPGNPLILTQDFRGPQGYRLRARVQWLDGTDSETGHFLVMLEDPNSAALSQAQLKALELRLTRASSRSGDYDSGNVVYSLSLTNCTSLWLRLNVTCVKSIVNDGRSGKVFSSRIVDSPAGTTHR